MRVPRIRFLVCGAVAVLTAPTLATAPASGDSKYVLVARPALPPPAPDRATIVLVREQFARAKPMPQKNLFLDGAPLGLLMQKTLVIAQVTPGMHAIQASSDCVPLACEVGPGETRMFRLREVINDLDIAETSWIEDDPHTFDELVRKEGLRESRLGPEGLPFLQEKVHKLDDRPDDEIAWLGRAGASDSVVFEDILYDRPFRPDDVSRAFKDKPGTLILTHQGLEYRQKGERFVLPWTRIERVRFAGSRFFEENPWVGFEHHDRAGQLMIAAFTDQRPPYMARTYERIYAVAQRLWRDANSAEGSRVER